MTAILDLNDASLALWHGSTQLRSPGFAWHDGARYHFGLSAQATARKTPRAVNTRYWWQLSTEPLVPALGPARHSADLVWSHLSDIHGDGGTPERVIFAAPGSMSVNQLSLLLGIVGSLPFSVDAVVHRSAALAAGLTEATAVHVEVQLNQILVTPVSREGDTVQAGESQPLPGRGLIALRDELAEIIAGLFVDQTRFDPHRSAASEQALYDALPGLLREIADRGETRVSIDGYQARVTREQLHPVGRALGRTLAETLRALVPGDATTVLLDPHLVELPGLELAGPVLTADSQMLVAALAGNAHDLRQPEDALTFQRQLPAVMATSPAGPGQVPHTSPGYQPDPSPVRPLPTHLLEGSYARAISDGINLDGGGELKRSADAVTLAGDIATDLLVNGALARSGQRLECGDTLSDSLGYEAMLIAVEVPG